jgi:hypothetical protein
VESAPSAGVASPSWRSDRVAVSAVILFVAVCAAASFSWIYGSQLAFGPPIRSDAMGYYLYLPAVMLDRDITLERTAERSFAGRTWEMEGVRRVEPRDRFLDKYPPGEAIMLVPFFVLGDAAARVSGARTDGFSTPYQWAAAAGGLVYALLGLAVLGFLLLRWFSSATVVLTLLGITFGTSLFHYSTYDAVFSHAFSFFLVALILRLALSVYERPQPWNAAALGLASGLLAAVRPTNVTILVFVSLLGVTNVHHVTQRVGTLRRHARLLAPATAAFVLPLLPQVAYWHAITGKFFVYTYRGEHLDVLHPHLLEVLFSVRKGLFFWAPLLLLAVLGLLFLRRHARETFVPAVAYLVVSTWVIASWSTWWYGGSLGQRAFVETLPVFALGLAALIETARQRVARGVLVTLVGALTLLAVHNTVAYWQHEIPIDQTSWDTYVRSFGMYG